MKISKRKQKLLFQSILLLVFLILGGVVVDEQQIESVTQGQIQPGFFRVISISDGDTISVEMDGRAERIRMIGVDTPETHHPSKPVQCFGQAASNFTKKLIGTSAVRLVADRTNSNRDRYNRLLRYVYLPNNKLVNAEIIKQGYGFAYVSFPFEKMEEFRGYERTARKNNLGLWGGCNVIVNQYGSPESPAAIE